MITKEQIEKIALKTKTMSLSDYIEKVAKNSFIILRGGEPVCWGNMPGDVERKSPIVFNDESCDGEVKDGDVVVNYLSYLKSKGIA